jgi:hypothetical protein
MRSIGLVVLLTALVPLGLAHGQGSDLKHEDILQKLLGTLQEITKTLGTIKDDASAQAARPDLKKQAEDFRETRKQSEKVPPPTPEARERIAKEFQPKFIAAKKELIAEMARVQRVPGGLAALQEIRSVLEKSRD